MTKSDIRNTALVFVEILIGFSVICVLPFAWILRDGLGPNSVSTNGLFAASKAFMTFYIGPVILLLVSLDLTIRRFVPSAKSPSPKSQWTTWIIAISFIMLLSYVLVWLLRT